MTENEVLDEFRAAGALLQGHFILTSGLRSPVFLQKMFVFQDPKRTEKLCRALAQKIESIYGKIDIVVSPAVGGIVAAEIVAKANPDGHTLIVSGRASSRRKGNFC